MPRLCEFCPGICLTTEGKARKKLKSMETPLKSTEKHQKQEKPQKHGKATWGNKSTYTESTINENVAF